MPVDHRLRRSGRDLRPAPPPGAARRTTPVGVPAGGRLRPDDAALAGTCSNWAAQATAEGLPIKAQVLSRAIGVMLGHETDLEHLLHLPDLRRAGATAVRREDPGAAQARGARRASLPSRPIPIRAIVSSAGSPASSTTCSCSADPPDYEQPLEQSIAARARHAGVTPEELVYDLMLERDGRNNLYVTLCNYPARLARNVARDDAAPRSRPGAGRRRCALRDDLRRQLSDLHADPLGPRPAGAAVACRCRRWSSG